MVWGPRLGPACVLDRTCRDTPSIGRTCRCSPLMTHRSIGSHGGSRKTWQQRAMDGHTGDLWLIVGWHNVKLIPRIQREAPGHVTVTMYVECLTTSKSTTIQRWDIRGQATAILMICSNASKSKIEINKHIGIKRQNWIKPHEGKQSSQIIYGSSYFHGAYTYTWRMQNNSGREEHIAWNQLIPCMSQSRPSQGWMTMFMFRKEWKPLSYLLRTSDANLHHVSLEEHVGSMMEAWCNSPMTIKPPAKVTKSSVRRRPCKVADCRRQSTIKSKKKWRKKFKVFEKVKSGDLWDFEVSGGSGQHGSLYEVSFFVQQVTEFAWI